MFPDDLTNTPRRRGLALAYAFLLTVARALIYGVTAYGCLHFLQSLFPRDEYLLNVGMNRTLIGDMFRSVFVMAAGLGRMVSYWCVMIVLFFLGVKHLRQMLNLLLIGVPEGMRLSFFAIFNLNTLLYVHVNTPPFSYQRPMSGGEPESGVGDETSSPLPRNFREACVVLGLMPGLSKASYRRAYHEKAQEHHPDRLQGTGVKIRKLAEEEMKRINAAWAIIDRELPG